MFIKCKRVVTKHLTTKIEQMRCNEIFLHCKYNNYFPYHKNYRLLIVYNLVFIFSLTLLSENGTPTDVHRRPAKPAGTRYPR